MHFNRIQKIVSKFCLDKSSILNPGDFVSIQPSHVMTHDNTGAVLKKFSSIGAEKVFNPSQVVFTLDHNVQDFSKGNLDKYKKIKEFSETHSIDFYAAGSGIGHQIMIEQGYAFPNSMVVASDSHSNMYGGLGCLGTPVVRTDAASIWATGQTWWQIPHVTKVNFINSLPDGCTGKDVIIALCGHFNQDQVLNHALEFEGPGLRSLSIDDRLTISNMTTEWGALAGIFPVDHITLEYVRKRISRLGENHSRYNYSQFEKLSNSLMNADEGAEYSQVIDFDLSSVEPYISGPDSVKKMQTLQDLQKKKIKVNKAYLVSCVNSRASDIKAAAEVFKDKKVAAHVEFYIAAASSEVEKEAKISGDWQKLLNAGAKPLVSGCGPCIGLGAGLLKEGEVGISATNRNYKGRMGSPLASTYLASPAVVAASAINGYISGPESWASKGNIGKIQATISKRASNLLKKKNASSKVYDGFHTKLSGEIIFCDQDNLNTDGIYPGKYTYDDEISPEKMAKVVMENYDQKFASIIQKNDILVAGFNFGTGSSREQAATALKYAGIKLILAGSFSETFKRNAINNGLLVLECPSLVNDLREKMSKISKVLTWRSGINATANLISGEIIVESNKYDIPPVGYSAQELLVEGGLESWISKKVAEK